MDPSTPTASVHEQIEQERKPLGRVPHVLLGLLTLVLIVAFVFGSWFVSFLMNANLPLTLLIVLVGTFASFPVLIKVDEYRRRRSGIDVALAAIDTWARVRGLKRTDDHGLTLAVATAPFDLAGLHTAVHSWTGRYQDQSVAMLHYLVDTGTAEHPERQLFTVVAATGNGDFPLTEAVPQRGAAGLAARVGQDVESAEFNRAWRVSWADERAAHSLLTPRVIERMVLEVAHAVRTVWSGGVIVTVERGAILDTGDLDRRLRYVTDLAGLVPGFARTDGGLSGAPAAQAARVEVTAQRKRGRDRIEMALLVLALASLAAAALLWRAIEDMAIEDMSIEGQTIAYMAAWALLVLGFVIAGRSPRIAAWIRRRRRRTQHPPAQQP